MGSSDIAFSRVSELESSALRTMPGLYPQDYCTGVVGKWVLPCLTGIPCLPVLAWDGVGKTCVLATCVPCYTQLCWEPVPADVAKGLVKPVQGPAQQKM